MGFREGNEKTEDAQESLRLDEPTGDEETKVRLDVADDDNDADDSDADGEEPKAAAAPKPGEQPRKRDGKWAEKKAERGRDRREAKSWEREKTEYDDRLKRVQDESDRRYKQLTEEFDRFRQTSGGGGGGQQQQQDPFAAPLADIERQLDQELQLIETDANRGYKAYNQLRRKEQELITQRGIAMAMAEQSRDQQQRPQDPYAYRRPIIASEYPWTDDPRYGDLSRKAAAYREYLIKVEGKPDTIETDREALTSTVARFGPEFGLRPPPAAPSQRTRSLWQGPASRGVADRRPATQEVELGELGRGHGLTAPRLRAALRSALDDEN